MYLREKRWGGEGHRMQPTRRKRIPEFSWRKERKNKYKTNPSAPRASLLQQRSMRRGGASKNQVKQFSRSQDPQSQQKYTGLSPYLWSQRDESRRHKHLSFISSNVGPFHWYTKSFENLHIYPSKQHPSLFTNAETEAQGTVSLHPLTTYHTDNNPKKAPFWRLFETVGWKKKT